MSAPRSGESTTARLERRVVDGLGSFSPVVNEWARDLRAALDENERLRRLLTEANDAFDECTGDYPKTLVEGEEWRQFATDKANLSARNAGVQE
jgi:hypothetical protein